MKKLLIILFLTISLAACGQMTIRPTIGQFTPSLVLDFSRGTFPIGPTFTRSSIATYFDQTGTMQTASANTPRIDYDPVTGDCKGLLIEESRTNMLIYSNTLTTWTSAGAVAGVSAITLPGTSLGYNRFSVSSAGQVWHRIENPNTSLSVTSGTTYAGFVIYETTGTSGRIRIVLRDGTSGSSNETLISGLVGSPVNSQTQSGTVTILSNVALSPTVRKVSFSYTPNFTGRLLLGLGADNATSGTTAVFLAAQLEQGAFPTSFIPTTNVTATRAADVCSMSNISSWYNQSEGTALVEFSEMTTTASRLISFSDGGSNNSINAGGRTAASFYIFNNITVGGTNTANVTTNSLSTPQSGKLATAWKAGDHASSLNGGTIQSSSNAAALPTVNKLNIGRNESGVTLNGYIRRLVYYPRRLPNAYLQSLTQ
jgi:hypothetical protein